MTRRAQQPQFEALLHEHRRIAFKIAAAYTRTPHDRDDLVQEITVQLWRSFGSFDSRRAKFSTWMYRVALNVAISHARNVKRSGAERFESLSDVHRETLADAGTSQHEALERDERVAALRVLIARLDGLNRALVLLYLEDRSYTEIAEVLGISETNVATKLNRIKQQLRGQVRATETAGVKNGTR